ncbi:MAG: PT domain-containing protein, partial [Oscillospiraceae bacterium]|nr:PT domain-containing protein [Oscillospiraceae bacterium]
VSENSWSDMNKCYILSECEAQDNKAVIEEAGFVNYEQPVAGDTVADFIASLGFVNDDQYSPLEEEVIVFAELDENNSMVGELLEDDYVFEAGKTYALLAILEPNEGYKFSVDETALTVNGGTDLLHEESEVESEAEAMLIVTFTVVEEPAEDNPTDDPTDEPTDEPTDDPTDEPTDEPIEDKPVEEKPSDDNAQTGASTGYTMAVIAIIIVALMLAIKTRRSKVNC